MMGMSYNQLYLKYIICIMVTTTTKEKRYEKMLMLEESLLNLYLNTYIKSIVHMYETVSLPNYPYLHHIIVRLRVLLLNLKS